MDNDCMRTSKLVSVALALILLLAGCKPAASDQNAMENSSGSDVGSPVEDSAPEVNEPSQPGADPATPGPTSAPDCYPEGEHPIAAGIADDYSGITDYNEVMTWFCNGAEFEDILNALTTEEITEVDAEEFLWMLAEGYTWEMIWDQLDLTNE